MRNISVTSKITRDKNKNSGGEKDEPKKGFKTRERNPRKGKKLKSEKLRIAGKGSSKH